MLKNGEIISSLSVLNLQQACVLVQWFCYVTITLTLKQNALAFIFRYTFQNIISIVF